MAATLILWAHALAALLFGALAVLAVRQDALRRRALPIALALTAVAALAVAGLGVRDVGAALAIALRDAAWIVTVLLLVGRHRAGHPALLAVGVSVGLAGLAAVTVTIIASLPAFQDVGSTLFAFAQALRMMALAGGLLLAHHALEATRRVGDPRANAGVLAVGLLWAGELATHAVAWSQGDWPAAAMAARGAVLLAAAVLMAAALTHQRETAPAVSRQVAWRLLGGLALAGYLALVMLASGWAATLGPHARVAEVAVVIGAGAALLTLLATPWMRAWARVTLAKHLFGHRYDYRVEWQRFTAALAGSEPLGERIVRAIAGFTDAPGGLLLVADGDRLVPDAEWQWTPPSPEATGALLTLLARGWTVELDRIRDRTAAAEELAAVPSELIGHPDAWVIVPLIHDDTLVAAIVLARPPVARALDWEDFDLMRVAGRQAASHLAEDRARAALVEARRFDEFNRRFAFIMHDLKNLVSQMTLTASNARRHADNPEFRADMVATLGDCAERMTQLLQRLASHGDQPAEPLAAINAAALASGVAKRFAPRPIAVSGHQAPMALAHRARLEQVLGHLLQNAIEASAPDGAITVAVAGIDASVTIDVADRGAGMTAGFVRDELFRPFASSKPGGFGLGAHEARQLVAAMGGTLLVESRVGEGTCFRIVLSAAPALEAAA